MSPFAGWLESLLSDGTSTFAAPPTEAPRSAAVLDVLRDAFADALLDLAGPPVPFDADAAWGAAAVAYWACADVTYPECDFPDATGALPGVPASAAAHFSADVTLRFLPPVLRRAGVRGADDPLAAALDALMRRWPLSGVLADLDGGPTIPPSFGGHAGLQLLYAERFAARPRAGWLPPPGPGREQVERVFAALGRPPPQFLKPEVTPAGG